MPVLFSLFFSFFFLESIIQIYNVVEGVVGLVSELICKVEFVYSNARYAPMILSHTEKRYQRAIFPAFIFLSFSSLDFVIALGQPNDKIY